MDVRRRLMLGIALAGSMVVAVAAPATALVPPYPESAAGSQHSTYATSPTGTASGTSDATADASTGRLHVTAAASESLFPVGCPVITCLAVSEAYGSGWISETRSVPPGDYVVTARFKNGSATSTSHPGPIGATVPVLGGYIESTYVYAAGSLRASCAGCSVGYSDRIYLNATARTGTLVLGVTVPDGPNVDLFARAVMDASASTFGIGDASVDATVTIDRIAIFRGDEEL